MRHMALDVGDERIGIAISDQHGYLARPMEVISRVAGPASFEHVAQLIAGHEIGLLVVGWPLLPDGSEGKQVRSVEAYLRGLAPHVDIPIVRWDERNSTREAIAVMAETGKGRRRARRMRDAVAAAVILQDYLNHKAGRPAL